MAYIFKRFFKEEDELLLSLPAPMRKLLKCLFKRFIIWLVGAAIPYLLFMATAKGETLTMTGLASYYGGGEKLNKYTAAGEVFDREALTCAIWDFPFGTYLRVTNLANDYSVVVKVNDRGPARRLGCLINLTCRAFSEIASLKEGLIRVKVEIYDPGYGSN